MIQGRRKLRGAGARVPARGMVPTRQCDRGAAGSFKADGSGHHPCHRLHVINLPRCYLANMLFNVNKTLQRPKIAL